MVGLEGVKRSVRRLALPGNCTHAVLLYGGGGSGKSTVARFLAQAWLCLSPQNGEACGACPACRSFKKGQNADFISVEPMGRSSLILLRQIVPVETGEPPPHVPITVFLRTPPLSSRHKVVLIEDADRMNPDSANALLKSLEEPSESARFVLTTSSLGQVLPTVRSRCMGIACPYPMARELPDTIDRRALDLADGSLGEAERVSAKPELHQRLWKFAEALPSREPCEALSAADEFKNIADEWAEAYGLAARKAQTEVLAVLARYIIKLHPGRPAWVQAVIEAHRRIQQNAHPLATLDALFAGLLLQP